MQNLFPIATTVGNPGLFADPSTYGLVQGTAFPDPSTYFRLRGGILAASETLPMWGGCALYENVPGGAGAPLVALGSPVGRANALTGSKAYAGFAVFDQNYAWVNSPSSNAPQAQPGQTVAYYPKGSLARITVACDPALAAILQGGPTNAQVSFDWVNQLLVPYLGTLTISSGTYNSGTGVIVLTMSAPVTFDAGDACVLSGLTGTGAFAALDGTWTSTVVSGAAVTLQGPVGAGAATITGGSLTLGSGASEALPVTVQDVQTSNCVTVAYSAGSGATNYAFSGACAVIQI